MNKSSKLEPIAKIRKQQELNAGRLHGESIRQAEKQQKQLDELMTYREQYSQSFLSASQSGLSAIQMQEYRIFINRLDEAIKQQRQFVNNDQHKCEKSQKEWMNKRSECKMIDKVVENRQQAEHQEKEKSEQRALDNRPHKVFDNR